MPTVHDSLPELGTWLDGLLDRLGARLAARGVYPSDALWPYLGAAEDLLAAPPRESFCVVSAAAVGPEDPLLDGGGAEAPAYAATLTLTQYARLLADQALRDRARLVDKTLGFAKLTRTLVAAVQFWDGADAAGHSPLSEPARLAGPVRFNPRRTPPGWASAESAWALKFTAKLT
jgi:hypothetical protein